MGTVGRGFPEAAFQLAITVDRCIIHHRSGHGHPWQSLSLNYKQLDDRQS